MHADRWREVRDLFERVVDLEPEQRCVVLDDVCADDSELRREVESLVAESAQQEQGIPEVIGGAAQDLVRDREAGPGPTRLGTYRVIEQIGRGGMGAVYLAEREGGPYHQQVAVKVLRPDLVATGLEARFTAERQILADLRHPNIARLIDGGTSADGAPYLVMEYVDGERIDRWCDQRRLTLEARLELFDQVCAAVQAAHRSLIVHRDLKPANILVTGDGHAKLLDFGIAKILEPSAHLHTMAVTRTLERLLTPAYASPEQVMGRPVTTASDVYSLGVVLYELLVGAPPHTFDSGAAAEVERVVCHENPGRPSLAVRRGADTAAGREAASRRSQTVERLARRLTGDLDIIVMTALRKEPERRYPTVEALAEDLRRHLAGLPVRARPDTVGYRAGKFVRRHRAPVIAASIGLCAVLVFAANATVNARRAVRERDRAQIAEERARVEARTAERVSSFLVDLFRVADPGEARGEEPSIRELLDRGADRVDDELAGEPEVRARLLGSIGQVYRNLGEFPRAAELLEEAVSVLRAELPDSPNLPAALNHLGQVRFDLGDLGAAQRLAEEALATARQRFPGDHAQTAEALNSLGLLAFEATSLEEAEDFHQQALDMRLSLWGEDNAAVAESLFNLGNVALEREQLDRAAELHERGFELRRRVLGVDHPLTLSSVGVVVASLEAKNEYARGLDRLEDVMPVARRVLGPEHPEIAYLEVMRGRQLRFLGRTDEAEAAFAEALRIERQVRGPDHPYVGYAQIQLGVIRVALGRLDEAENAYREALRIYQSVHPNGDRNVANALGKLAELELERNRGDRALDYAHASRDMFGRLLEAGHPELLQGDALIGEALAMAGRTAEARRILETALPGIVAVGGENSRTARRVRAVLAALPLIP